MGAVLIPGASAPKLVRREMIANMKRGAVVVDVAIDQGGCFETSHATTHTEPVYFVDGVLHYCVSNMPAAVPHTSTFALTNATFPYLLELANHGLEGACTSAAGAARRRQHLQRLRDPRRGGANRKGRQWRELARWSIGNKAMPASAQQTEIPPQPLTALTEDEKLFQTTVRQFAREQIGPYVREMDEAGVFRKDIIRQFFEMGLMGIEIPEEYGGSGGSFFQCILAVEELSAVDPSAGVIADVQNTIVQQRDSALGQCRAEEEVSAAAGHRHGGFLRAFRSRIGIGRLRPGHARGGRRRPFSADRAASCGSPTPPNRDCSCCSPTPIRMRDTAASRRF